ncbi:LytTR family DNA-binding domain-containing protein [Bifidobacterium aquikefiri]|uniref:Response regulator receiver protein n=1 Tax=Bifidobacterium aquikefiri TaxID=1653207 RepID=A0A261GBE6_9BIFI|nr:LytTR family DNA-binding domain-containing protein [Bifidobacterium aquikefiri]OZG68724.1 response regulator receiver protein [Bifidobacterium aquikefiri]
MHITYEYDPGAVEPVVIVRSPSMDDATRHIMALLRRDDGNSSDLLEVDTASGTSLVPLRDVAFLYAQAGKVYARCGKGDWKVRRTLRDLTASLPGKVFQRVSKSQILNFSYVVRFDLTRQGTVQAILRDGSIHKVTDSYIDAIKRRIIGS